MRLALGAGRGRLAWQLMIEAALLATVAIVRGDPAGVGRRVDFARLDTGLGRPLRARLAVHGDLAGGLLADRGAGRRGHAGLCAAAGDADRARRRGGHAAARIAFDDGAAAAAMAQELAGRGAGGGDPGAALRLGPDAHGVRSCGERRVRLRQAQSARGPARAARSGRTRMRSAGASSSIACSIAIRTRSRGRAGVDGQQPALRREQHLARLLPGRRRRRRSRRCGPSTIAASRLVTWRR